MSRSFGEQFREHAIGPIALSDKCVAAGNLDEALSHLSRALLMGAVREGVENLARSAGVAPLSIFKHLPMDKLERLMDGLEAARSRATSEATMSASAAASGDGPSPLDPADSATDSGASWRRLAALHPTEGQLAVALTAIADSLDQWQLAVQECCVQINGLRKLEKAYQRRQLKRFAMFVPLAMVLGLGGAWFARWQLASSQVREALASGGPCAAEQIDAEDLERVGAGLAADVQTARQRCREQREQQRQLEEEQRQLEEKRRIEDKRLEERRRACQRLSEHLLANALDAADQELAGSHVELLQHVASKTIESHDISRDVSTLACDGTPGGKTIRSACATALIESWSSWITQGTVSPSVRTLIADAKPEMDDVARAMLKRQVRQQADGAMLTGNAKGLARSETLCSLLEALGIELPRPCATLREKR